MAKHRFKLEKLLKYGRRAGHEALAFVEAIYHTLSDARLSRRQRGLLIGALAYFLAPLDAIPDLLPGGFLDDIPILIGALVATGTIGREQLKAARQRRGLAATAESQVDHEDHTKTSAQPQISDHTGMDSGDLD